MKVLEKVSGPVPKRAVLKFLNMSTAIDQPAERGSSRIWETPSFGRRRLIWVATATRVMALLTNKRIFKR